MMKQVYLFLVCFSLVLCASSKLPSKHPSRAYVRPAAPSFNPIEDYKYVPEDGEEPSSIRMSARASTPTPTPSPTQAPLSPYWRLAWSDEFTESSINTNIWNLRFSDGNEGNAELEYYDPNTISVSNGNLVITAEVNTSNGKSYNSGWMDTHNNWFSTYGRYEFRAQMPGGASSGYGFWPAMWLLSQETCWPEGSEFDIAEYRGAYPTVMNGYYHYAAPTSACGGGELSSGASYTASASFGSGYHIFALEWFPSNATWYIDNTVLFTQQVTALTNGGLWDPAPHYIIINFAVGGSYPGNPKSSTVFPAPFLVDYVRFYVYRQSCTASACSGNGCCNSNTMLCTCNAGWSGSSCEYFSGSLVNKFASTNTQYTPATDNPANGWGNGFTLFLSANVAISSGLTLTLTNYQCPSECGNLGYSGGGWNSIQYYSYGTFSWYAKASNVPGTGFTMGVNGPNPNNPQQIYFQINGAQPSVILAYTYSSAVGQYEQVDYQVTFDTSQAYHNYSFVYMPTYITFYVDGVEIRNNTYVNTIPSPPLSLNAFYSAQPAWYGGTFNFQSASKVIVQQVTWLTANIPVTSC